MEKPKWFSHFSDGATPDRPDHIRPYRPSGRIFHACILQQAAWVAIRTSPRARAIYARIAKRAGSKKAATAMARKLLTYAWSVCRQNTPFHWPGESVPQAPQPAAGPDFEI